MSTGSQTKEADSFDRSSPLLFRQCGGIALGMIAAYLFLFPLTVVAADAAGFSLRNETQFGKAITNPLLWIAGKVPPYKSYLETSQRFVKLVYRSN